MSIRPVSLDIYRSAIPMRSFEHAAARREESEAVVVRASFSDGSEGWGETLPRPYVTGETIETVIRDLEAIVWPTVAGREVSTRGPGDYPLADPAGRRITAAACAMDLAMSGIWSGGAGLRTRIDARVSGVLGSSDPARTLRRLRLMRLFGLRDFKLKLGMGQDVDDENLRLVHRHLSRGIAAGKCTLRVDINGGWDAASTPQRVERLIQFGVGVVEQPAFCGAGELVELARRCPLPLMADESLVTQQDARSLLEEPSIWWNIRLSKNGGLGPCMRLAAMAREAGVKVVAGCMVGESSILSAAQRRLLQRIDAPRFVEGNYGRFLLRDDLVHRALRFGYGGRLRCLKGDGLGIRIDVRKLMRYAQLIRTLRE